MKCTRSKITTSTILWILCSKWKATKSCLIYFRFTILLGIKWIILRSMQRTIPTDLNIQDWSEKRDVYTTVRVYIYSVFGCSHQEKKIGWVKSNELESKYHVYCSFTSSRSRYLPFVYPNAVCSWWLLLFLFVDACCLSCKEWAKEK